MAKTQNSQKQTKKQPLMTPAQKKGLREERGRVTPETLVAFDAAFTAWKKTWFSGGLAISSDPHTRTVGKEFDALVALGPAILPLVIETLADPEMERAGLRHDKWREAKTSQHNEFYWRLRAWRALEFLFPPTSKK